MSFLCAGTQNGNKTSGNKLSVSSGRAQPVRAQSESRGGEFQQNKAPAGPRRQEGAQAAIGRQKN
jgi:hypothetical protein